MQSEDPSIGNCQFKIRHWLAFGLESGKERKVLMVLAGTSCSLLARCWLAGCNPKGLDLVTPV